MGDAERCCSGSSATPGHPYNELHQRLVDFSSIRADGGLTSRCRSRSNDKAGFETKRQEKCAFSITENHLSGRGVGFDHDAGTSVPCLHRVDPLASLLEADASSTAHAFKLPGRYVTPPVTSRLSIGLITQVIQSVITLKAVP